jgi:hypothetical protein
MAATPAALRKDRRETRSAELCLIRLLLVLLCTVGTRL